MQKGFAPIFIILIVLAIILAGGAGWFFLSRSGTPETSSESITPGEETSPSTTDTISETTETIASIVSRGQSLECDWRMPIESAENPFNTGKLYTTGNKGRSHMTGTISGVTMEGNAIYMDGAVYTWMNLGGQKIGFKMDPDKLAEADKNMTPQQRQQAEQISAQMIFNCQPWTPDESQFTLPTDVTFR